MYECLYGYTPFACENRQDTKLRILRHRTTLKFPNPPKDTPLVSFHALDFMISILQEKEDRLCSKRYKHNDYVHQMMYGLPQNTTKGQPGKEFRTHFVYPDDAEDIKNHSFFRTIPWEDLHKRKPPFVPRVRNWEDTKYFDDDDMISDISDSSDDPGPPDDQDTIGRREQVHGVANNVSRVKEPGSRVSQHLHEGQKIVPSAGLDVLKVGGQLMQPLIANPLRPTMCSQTSGAFRGATVVETRPFSDNLIRYAKPKKRKKEKKRPRDKILRDANCAKTSLEMRKRGAFLGYGYRRAKAASEIIAEVLAEVRDRGSNTQKFTVDSWQAGSDLALLEANDVPMEDRVIQ